MTNWKPKRKHTTVPQWTGKDGHLYVTLERPTGEMVDEKVADLMLLTFVGPKPHPDAVAVHLDGDKMNNVKDNLRWSD